MKVGSDRKLRVGIIGAGVFAADCHIPGIQSHPNAEVVALCGRRLNETRALADRFQVPDVHTDYRELCVRSDIDAVTIVTPEMFHRDQALCAFAHGKHVLCEKPLAMNVAEARQMVDAAQKSGLVHQVGFIFRYNDGIAELRRRVAAGEIGDPFYLRIQYDTWDGLRPDWQVTWRDRYEEAAGGVIFHIGVHLFDIARYLLGTIESATGFCFNLPRQRADKRTREMTSVETDDFGNCWFQFASGVRGQWCVSRVTPPFAEYGYVEVIGTEGALKAALSRGRIDVLKTSRPTEPAWKEVDFPREGPSNTQHALDRLMHGFVNACLRGYINPDLDASFHDGLAAQQGVAAILATNGSAGWVRLEEAE
jgi:predicted dehydrogenase